MCGFAISICKKDVKVYYGVLVCVSKQLFDRNSIQANNWWA